MKLLLTATGLIPDINPIPAYNIPFLANLQNFTFNQIFFIFKGHPTKLLKVTENKKNPLKTVDIIK